MGAGFSIKQGVTTKVKIDVQNIISHQIFALSQMAINQIKQMYQNMF